MADDAEGGLRRVEIKMTLSLPRDELSVPVIRRITASAMTVLGVDERCAADLQLALTEACTNVLDHAVEGDEYEISAGIYDNMCVVEVVDTGHRFDSEGLGLVDADHSAEEGRGIQLMRALVDRVQFTSRPEKGTIVHLEKRLEWHEGAPVKRLADARGDS